MGLVGISVWLLNRAERFFLESHGWVHDETNNTWSPPASYPFRAKDYPYTHGHAVNAQKAAHFSRKSRRAEL